MQQENKDDKNICWETPGVVFEFNKFYDKFRDNPETSCHFKYFKKLLKLIRLPEGSTKTLVDVGCGTGYLQEYCSSWNYVGLDMPHIIEGCLKKYYPNTTSLATNNFFKDDENSFKDLFQKLDAVVVGNGLIDVMEHSIESLTRLLDVSPNYLIVHRQEITEDGVTESVMKPAYNAYSYHSIINRKEFDKTVMDMGFYIVGEEMITCGFPWENGGSSFLLKRKS